MRAYRAVNGTRRSGLKSFRGGGPRVPGAGRDAGINPGAGPADNHRVSPRLGGPPPSPERPHPGPEPFRVKKRKPRLDHLVPHARRLARFLLKSQLLTIFLGLALLGLWVGLQSRPQPGVIPYTELFDAMTVVSFRESPADTAARFLIELRAGGRVFSQYDLEARAFRPAPRGRDYSRNITGTHYRPLKVRGHVAYGFWLDVPNASRRALLPEQFDELYRSTLDFVKPVSLLSSALGILSGYSVGYRLGTWNGSLSSRAVQERVLGTPELGRTLAREAWRRVLLEPAVMADENDAARFAAVAGTQRLYAGFFRTALNDSDGFIPREAARLERAGRAGESRTMLAFASAVRRAALDSVHLTSVDFAAVERWASLLDRRGHWAQGTFPPAGEERVQLLGTLAWYGLAPPPAEVSRVWIGPRLLVREGETEGFVTDEIPGTGVGCPIAWRDRLREEHTGATAMANAWMADRPEFVALAALGRRTAASLGRAGRNFAAWQRERNARRRVTRDPAAAVPTTFSGRPSAGAERRADSTAAEPLSLSFPLGEDGRVILVGADSAAAEPLSLATRAVFDRADSLIARAGREGLGNAGPAPRPEWDLALRRMGAENLAFDTTTHRVRATWEGVRMDLGEIATGHALEDAADTLRTLGVRGALIEVSSNTVAFGANGGSDRWRAALRDPRERIARVGWIRLRPGDAASRSLAPGGWPEESPLAVAVVAPSAMSAQAWRTELLGSSVASAKRIAKERSELSAVLIERGAGGLDVLWVESDLKERFTLEPGAEAHFRLVYF